MERELVVDAASSGSEETSQRPLAVLETKYKADEQPSEDDIYQIAFHARELQAKRAMLVYPSMLPRPLRMLHGNDIRLDSVVFDIGASPDLAGAAFLDALNARIATEPLEWKGGAEHS